MYTVVSIVHLVVHKLQCLPPNTEQSRRKHQTKTKLNRSAGEMARGSSGALDVIRATTKRTPLLIVYYCFTEEGWNKNMKSPPLSPPPCLSFCPCSGKRLSISPRAGSAECHDRQQLKQLPRFSTRHTMGERDASQKCTLVHSKTRMMNDFCHYNCSQAYDSSSGSIVEQASFVSRNTS